MFPEALRLTAPPEFRVRRLRDEAEPKNVSRVALHSQMVPVPGGDLFHFAARRRRRMLVDYCLLSRGRFGGILLRQRLSRSQCTLSVERELKLDSFG